MKKFLLMAALAAGTMTANAQMKLPQKNVTDCTGKVELSVSDVTRGPADPVLNMYYYRPAGLFYSGWNKAFRNPGIAFAPIDFDLTFVADYKDGIPFWQYPNGNFDADGAPSIAEADNKDEIMLHLPAGNYFTPALVNKEDQKDFFVPAGVLEVGGTSRIQSGEEEGEEVSLDAYAVNYVPTMDLGIIPQYLCTANPDADTKFATEIAGDESFSTKGFGELFTSPASFQLRGFNVLVYAESVVAENAKGVTASIMELSGKTLSDLVDKKGLEVEVTEVQAPDQNDMGVYQLLYTIKGDPITINADQLIIPSIMSNKVKMTPVFFGQPRQDREGKCATMMVCAEFTEGQSWTQYPLTMTKQDGSQSYVNCWAFGLDMSYAKDGFAGIDTVVADEVAGNGNVYSIEGVKVSNGDVENLPAGIYVKDGKKFVVR